MNPLYDNDKSATSQINLKVGVEKTNQLSKEMRQKCRLSENKFNYHGNCPEKIVSNWIMVLKKTKGFIHAVYFVDNMLRHF